MNEFPRPAWTGNASCAVTLTFDNFGESLDLLRHGHAGGATADGVYSPRRGIERTLDLLDRYVIPATFFLEGWNVRKYAPLASEIVARGHEVAAHGWMHERWNELSEDAERDLIRRTTETIAETLGAPPKGWRSPSGLTTTRTLELLHEESYEYDSSFGDEDIPYLLQISRDSDVYLPQLPWTWALDDAAYYAYPGTIRRPDEVVDLWIDEFDAAHSLTGSFMLVCHPRYSGRPARIIALERLIRHMQSYSDVWFARCDQVVEVVRDLDSTPRYPAPASMEEEK